MKKLTTQAINLKFADIRERFRAIEVEHPVDFIVWRRGLNSDQKARLQQAFSTRAIKTDAALIQDAEVTLKEMEAKHKK